MHQQTHNLIMPLSGVMAIAQSECPITLLSISDSSCILHLTHHCSHIQVWTRRRHRRYLSSTALQAVWQHCSRCSSRSSWMSRTSSSCNSHPATWASSPSWPLSHTHTVSPLPLSTIYSSSQVQFIFKTFKWPSVCYLHSVPTQAGATPVFSLVSVSPCHGGDRCQQPLYTELNVLQQTGQSSTTFTNMH